VVVSYQVPDLVLASVRLLLDVGLGVDRLVLEGLDPLDVRDV
jgi:hypothetical protein